MKTVSTVVLGATLLLPSVASAQGRSERIATQRDAMHRLADWVGEWTGGGWVETRPGEKARFTGTVVVESRLDDLVLIVDSEYVASSGPAKGRVVNNNVDIIWFDSETSTYQVETHAAIARHGTSDGTLQDGTLAWTRPGRRRGRETRYSIKVENGRWIQVGEQRESAEAPWHKTLEIELTPVSSDNETKTPAAAS